MKFSPRTWFTAVAVAALLSTQAQAETYHIDVVHSSIDFSIRHLVSRSKGKFNEYEGKITYDKDNPAST
jgi:polyisoprenoid-binding protein YceI